MGRVCCPIARSCGRPRAAGRASAAWRVNPWLAALSPRLPIAAQRWWMHRLARLNRPARGVAIEPARRRHRGRMAARDFERTTILYLHGGGFCTGSPATHRALTSRLARATGLPVFAADYRLAPEHPFPAAIEDAISAYLALAGPSSSRAIPPARGSLGDGARGQRARSSPARRPGAVLALDRPGGHSAAPADADDRRMAARLRAPRRRGPTLAAPLRADLRGLPPTLIQAGAENCCAAMRSTCTLRWNRPVSRSAASSCRALARLPAARRHAAERRCGARARGAVHPPAF